MHSHAKKAGFLLTGALVAGGLAVPAVQAAPTTDPEAAVAAYMASAGHRANILNPDHAFAATGTVIIDDVVDNTQRFNADCDETSEPTPEPTTEPSEEPTTGPSEEPTTEPSEPPTVEPEPTQEPTEEPAPEPEEPGPVESATRGGRQSRRPRSARWPRTPSSSLAVRVS